MKLNEVTQPSEQALFEAIDAQNDTGLQTEDVVKIIRSADGPWSGPFTLEESNVRLRALAEELGIPFEAQSKTLPLSYKKSQILRDPKQRIH